MSNKITKAEGIILRDKRIARVPKLVNREEAREAAKVKVKNTGASDNRAIILNFTHHSEPNDLRQVMLANYERIQIFQPLEGKGLFIYDNTDHVKYNPLITQRTATTEKSKSEQIHEWLYEYLSTKRHNGMYPLDCNGDYYVLLPQKDGQVAVEIMLALRGIKNIDWYPIWTIYNQKEKNFLIGEITSSKGIYNAAKKISSDVDQISEKKKVKILNGFSALEDDAEAQKYLDDLSEEDYNLIEHALTRRLEKRTTTQQENQEQPIKNHEEVESE